ncbi:GNAT family N-acetyltransferase [Planococcus sp. 107-1]|uniref:GNAT family N-acetyltransferase n=1 Tax=Planococcus sp. 107-1 TaxID=2908840 RepID=UPI001F1EC96D|nr:GNAT family N-acetyltransferase [Planococcus sp. 107-1]UJF25569.1 GNAT family N-acetyltransferase [Planococcus sp. 107-1]
MAAVNDLQLAKAIEELKIGGTKQYMEIQRQNASFYNGNYQTAEGKGVIFYTPDYCYGLGFGLGEPVQRPDLESVEAELVARNVAAHLHLEITPFSDEAFIHLLQNKGYTFDHFLSVWVLDTANWKETARFDQNSTSEILKVDDYHSYDWAWTVALGISQDHTVTEEAMESVRAFWEVPGNTAFLLKEGAENVAGATVAIKENLAELFLTATIKPYRGKGYQNRLIEERIRFAKAAGCQFITVTTKPGNSSARSMEKNGFSLMYQRAVLKSPPLI